MQICGNAAKPVLGAVNLSPFPSGNQLETQLLNLAVHESEASSGLVLGWPRLHLPGPGFYPGPRQQQDPPEARPRGQWQWENPNPGDQCCPSLPTENSQGACRERSHAGPTDSATGRLLRNEHLSSTCSREHPRSEVAQDFTQSPISLQNQKA